MDTCFDFQVIRDHICGYYGVIRVYSSISITRHTAHRPNCYFLAIFLSRPSINLKIATYLPTYLLTYLLTPCSRVLLEMLTGFQLVKKFPAYCGTRRFVTESTSARHLSLPCASSIQSITPHPTS